MQEVDPKHAARVKRELRNAGVSIYGLIKFASRYLPQLIHPDEHIGGVVYGRYPHGSGWLRYTEGMLVATDRRVIFLDHKPGYTAFDELTYDVISGVKLTSAGFSAVTLHTRLGDYLIRFVNTRAANNFTHYIETKRLEEDGQRPLVHHPPVEDTEPKIAIQQIDQKAMHFLRSHDIGVLSTISRTGGLHGAVVYYLLDNNGLIYVLTKSETHKAHNTFANPQVALTAYNEDKMQTVQVQGTAEIEADQSIKDHVFANLVKPRQYGTEKRLPPVTQLKEGSFMAIKITPTEAIYTDFKPEQ